MLTQCPSKSKCMSSKCMFCGVEEKCACGKCHKCGGVYQYNTGMMCGPPLAPSIPHTQKAKGIVALRQLGWGFTVSPILFTLSLDTTAEEFKTFIYPLFARPCPLTPRHGFVDSRVVKKWEELEQVLKETKTADPEGEVILMKYIPSTFNAVWVPNLLTVGKGNDGATAGVNGISFPLSGVIDTRLSQILPMADINVLKQDPFIEVVYGNPPDNHPTLTQLRSGPKLEGAGVDYLPTAIEVKEIIQVDHYLNLLEWETLIASKKDIKGLVVWHPGGLPTDHFSVHARSYHIPVCITFEPNVGQTLSAQTTTPPLDPLGVLRGVVAADSIKLSHDGEKADGRVAINLVLHTLHNSGAIGGDQSWWLGMGVGLMLRYGSIALRGEARHIKTNHMLMRDTVYSRALPHSLQRQRISCPALTNILRYGAFGGSVGGIKWARCGEALAKLFDEVGALAKDPTLDKANNLLRAFNFAVNQAHNGGWWLNKFTDTNAFTRVQKGDLTYTLSLPPFLWRCAETHKELTPDAITSRLTKWAKWVPLSLTPPPIQKAVMFTAPGVAGVAIKLEDKLLKNHHKPLIVGIKDLMEKLPNLVNGKLWVETLPTGLQVTLHQPHEEPIVLWTEPPIHEN